MNQKTKTEVYKRIYQELKKDPEISNLTYPKKLENHDFSCQIGDVQIEFSLSATKDSLKLRGTRHYHGISDDQLYEIGQSLIEGETINAAAYDGKIIFQQYLSFTGTGDKEAERNVYDTTMNYIRFIKETVLEGKIEAAQEESYPSSDYQDEQDYDDNEPSVNDEEEDEFSQQEEELPDVESYLSESEGTKDMETYEEETSGYVSYEEPEEPEQETYYQPSRNHVKQAETDMDYRPESERKHTEKKYSDRTPAPEYAGDNQERDYGWKDRQRRRRMRSQEASRVAGSYSKPEVEEIPENTEQKAPHELSERRERSNKPEKNTQKDQVTDTMKQKEEYSPSENKADKAEIKTDKRPYSPEVAEQMRIMMAEMNEAFQTRKEQNDIREKSLDDRKKELDERENAIKEKRSELDASLEQWDIRESQFQTRVDQLDMREDTIRLKENNLSEKEKKLSEKEEDILKRESALSESDLRTAQDIPALKGRISELEEALAYEKEEREKDLKDFESADQDLDDAENEIERLTGAYNSLSKSLVDAEKDITDLENQCNEKEKRLQAMTISRNDAEKQKDALQKENKELKDRISTIQKEVGETKKQDSADDVLKQLSSSGISLSDDGNGFLVGNKDGCSIQISPKAHMIKLEKPVKRGAKYRDFAQTCNKDIASCCMVYEKKVVYKRFYTDISTDMAKSMALFNDVK